MLKLFDIEISTQPRQEIEALLKEWLSERVPHQIITVNPEILVATVRDNLFREVIKNADLKLTDGAGIIFVSQIFGRSKPERITGVELVDVICQICGQLGRSVYLIGAEPGIAELAAEELQKRHPKLRIAGAEEGTPKQTDDKFSALEPSKFESGVVKRISEAKPAALFVAYGHLKQEPFIAKYKEVLGASVIVGVGGTFDFLSGKIKRAPKIFQSLWLEWLWRLILEPWRIKRIWDATVVFLWLVFKERLNKK